MMSASETIKKIRLEMCMEQVKFAKEVGVSKQTISNWERGRRSPTLSKIKELRELCVRNNITPPSVDSFLD